MHALPFHRMRRRLKKLITKQEKHKLAKQAKPTGARISPRPSQDVIQAAQALCAGFGKATVKKLEEIKLGRREVVDVAYSAWALARWYNSVGQYERALDNVSIRRLASPRAAKDKAHQILEMDALVRLNRLELAKERLQEAIERHGELSELCLCAANAARRSDSVSQLFLGHSFLGWLNKPFIAAGLPLIELKDSGRPVALDNIAAPHAVPHPDSGIAKISVLMPAYNAEATVAYAIQSVLKQTWTNLELIVVDDGSNDGTWSIVESLAAQDPRVVAIKHDENGGAYRARNTALRAATGELVTVQDSDDWSHPERLAIQAASLFQSGAVANLTNLTRVEPVWWMQITRNGEVLRQNLSSLLTARSRLIELGGWDECRMGADDELFHRLLTRYGAQKEVIHQAVPLCFAAAGPSSLTVQRDISRTTVHYGARREYTEAYRYWHLHETSRAAPDFTISSAQRRFPVPRICRPPRQPCLNYDILFVSDFSLPGGTTSCNANMLTAAKVLGLSCSCFHWPTPLGAGRDINVKIRKLLHEGIAQSVVVGERVACDLVLVHQPAVLTHLPDLSLEVQTRACVIIINQAPITRTQGGRTIYDADTIIENARAAFSVDPILTPISPTIRRILGAATQYARFSEYDWPPLSECAGHCRDTSAWDKFRRPIIGRHCRDHEDKWPSDPSTLSAAYCADTSAEVRILGGATHPKRILGALPTNWTVQPFDSVEVGAFLSGIDFFVHYPHEYCIEGFGLAALEAMAMGVPVILPPSMRETFGDGASYADPADVPGIVQSLWNDEEAYETQVQRGFEYVKHIAALAQFDTQVRPYLPNKLNLDADAFRTNAA